MSNDAAVITRRGPDTVRWPDIAFFSYKRVPKDQSPKGCPHVPPELILEVRSSLGSWATILTKVGEYLIAEVLVVCVVDLVTESIWVQPEQSGPRQLTANDDLTLPEVFPDFCVPVRQFFE
jgi:Uma2 family endonuclease